MSFYVLNNCDGNNGFNSFDKNEVMIKRSNYSPLLSTFRLRPATCHYPFVTWLYSLRKRSSEFNRVRVCITNKIYLFNDFIGEYYVLWYNLLICINNMLLGMTFRKH